MMIYVDWLAGWANEGYGVCLLFLCEYGVSFFSFYSLETVTEVINKMFMLMGFYIGL